jgi:hypothetical protein
VTEAESDHVPSYAVSSNDAASTAVIAKVSDEKSVKGSLATAQETLDKADGTVHIDYVNKKDLHTLTGLGDAFYPLAVSAVILLVALVLFARRKRNSGIEEL